MFWYIRHVAHRDQGYDAQLSLPHAANRKRGAGSRTEQSTNFPWPFAIVAARDHFIFKTDVIFLKIPDSDINKVEQTHVYIKRRQCNLWIYLDRVLYRPPRLQRLRISKHSPLS